jgi:hypothetical protein
VNTRPDPDRTAQARLITSLLQGFVRRCLANGDVTRRYAPEALAALVQGALGALFNDWAERGGFDPARRAADLAALVADALEIRSDEKR